MLTNFERSHWAGEKPYDRARANYIKNAVEKAGCENLESWRMLSKEPNILSRNEEALEQVFVAILRREWLLFFRKGRTSDVKRILSEMATPILGFSFTDSEPLRAAEITVLGLDAPNEDSPNSAPRRI